MLQKNKKIADFHFKLLHKILPSGENLFKWKMLNSPKCRFGCDTIETYEHMLVNCPKLQDTYSKITRVLKELHYDTLFTYKLLIFGYKISYPAYDDINMMLSHIFYAVYKYWLENDDKKELISWIKRDLKVWNRTYKTTTFKAEAMDKILKLW